MRFQDKVCVVTGGASGIGMATCERMAREGGLVAILDVDEQSGTNLMSRLNAEQGRTIFIKTDIGQSSQIIQAVESVTEKWGRIDVLVNNAAVMKFAPVTELSEADWDRVQTVNLKSVFMFCKHVLPHMKSGAIVNISSVHAHETTANCAPYAASKGGIEAFTRALSRELDPTKTRINCVAPGAVNTPLLWSNPNLKSGVEKIEGAIGEPTDLAAAICFMASDEARYIHGTTLVVDGGRLDAL